MNAKKSSKLDPGFGVGATGNQRILNKDGTLNLKRTGLSYAERFNPFHALLAMSWPRFVLLLLSAFMALNVIFALLYYWIGVDHLAGIIGDSSHEKFWEAFFFSTQTLTTVGYGRISPVGFITSLLASVESMGGVLAFAVATGLVYGRFSRPQAKILFSKSALISPYNNINALMVRIANMRENQLIDIEATITLSLNVEENGVVSRQFHILALERKMIIYLALNWTIVHPIDSESPLAGLSEQQLLDSKAEIIVAIKAFDDVFSQVVHTRSSYRADEVLWGQKFDAMYDRDENGIAVLHLEKINDLSPIALNPLVVSNILN